MNAPVPTPLTEEQQALFHYIDGLIPADGHLVYDLRDPKQYAFARMMDELNGFDAVRYPGFHRLLDDIRDHQHKNGYAVADPAMDTTGPWKDKIAIPLLGQDPGNRTVVQGMGTVTGGFKSMKLNMYVKDANSSKTLAKASAEAFAPNVILAVSSNPNTAQPATPEMIAYLNYSYQAKSPDTAPGESGVVKRVTSKQTTQIADPTVNHPTRNCTNPHNPDAITIGLGRGWPDQGNDMDYVWKEPTQDHPQGRIPFVGSVQFGKQIQALAPQTNFNLDITVANASDGGATQLVLPLDLDDVYANFSINPNNTKILQWNLPPGVNDLNTGNPITFHAIPWDSDMLAYFYCAIQVTLADGTMGCATIMSTDNPENKDPVDGTTYIMPIEFVWHCLAEGTGVTLADGGRKLIEEILRDDRVLGANNGRECVTATTRGRHRGRALQLTTAKGHTLVLSEKHVVMTTRGGVPANELQLGDKVIVRQGYAELIGLQEVRYEGCMYNLHLGGHVGHTATDTPLRTFFANDILVGDIRSQRAVTFRRSQDKEWVKARVGEYWAVDVESHFADKTNKS